MSYTRKVKFTSTNNFGCGPRNEEDVYTVAEFIGHCENGSFIDDDGFGHAVLNYLVDESIDIYPSYLEDIPSDATHIVWYNR